MVIDLKEYDVRNATTGRLTNMRLDEHIVQLFLGHWKTYFVYNILGFGIFWGIIEAINFFYPNIGLNSRAVLYFVLLLCIFGATLHCVYDYRRAIPKGLENESPRTQMIARSKKQYWEYALVYELLSKRIEKIDQDLENILRQRVHVKVVKSLDVVEYVQWMQTRPENLIRIIATAKQLLVFDLIDAIHADEGEKKDFLKLLRVVNLVRDVYKSTYDFEVEGREIIVPDGFSLIHEIQFGWTSVIRDGFHQMLSILKSVSDREKGDFSTIEGTITFEEPRRIDEFNEELGRLGGYL